MRTKLPALDFSQAEYQLMEEMRDRDWTNKIKGKEYADKRRRATTSDFEIGDEVLLKQKFRFFRKKYDDFQADLENKEFLARLAYLSDIFKILNNFNMSFQGPNGTLFEYI